MEPVSRVLVHDGEAHASVAEATPRKLRELGLSAGGPEGLGSVELRAVPVSDRHHARIVAHPPARWAAASNAESHIATACALERSILSHGGRPRPLRAERGCAARPGDAEGSLLAFR